VGELGAKLEESKRKCKELETENEELKTKGEDLGTKCNQLAEENLELLPRVTDIVVGETFKAMYNTGTRGRCRRKNRLLEIRSRRQRYWQFGLGSPADVDGLVEEVRFPIVKFCPRYCQLNLSQK